MLSKKPRLSASTIQFTPFRTIPTLNASNAPRNQRGPLGAPPRPESVTETPEILLVYGVEDRHHCLLYDFVFQRRDARSASAARPVSSVKPAVTLVPGNWPGPPVRSDLSAVVLVRLRIPPISPRPLPAQRHVSARDSCPAVGPRSDGAVT